MRHAAATVIGTVAGPSLLIAAKLATNPPDGGLVGNDAAKEALQAQSGNIATVSGATYANGAYKTSLAAALDAAHG